MYVYYYFGHLLSLLGAYLIPAGHEDGVDFESGAAASKTTVSHAKNTGSQKRRKLSSKTESAFKTTRSAGMYYVCMCGDIEGYKSLLCKIISFFWFVSTSPSLIFF